MPFLQRTHGLMCFDKLFQKDSGSDDIRIVLVDGLVEVGHGLLLGDIALAVLSPVGLQLLVDDLVVDRTFVQTFPGKEKSKGVLQNELQHAQKTMSS